MNFLLKVAQKLPEIVEKAKEKDVLGVLGEIDEEVSKSTKRVRVAGNIYSAVRAPLLFANGSKVQASQALTHASRFGVTEPFFKMVDDMLKIDRKASAADEAGVQILKHRTAIKAGKSIEDSGRMRPGKEGVLGPGIYFATDEEATKQKAVNGIGHSEPFAIVTALVELGKCRAVEIGEREWRMICDGGFDKTGLENLGFNSVGSCFNGGWEYCVFDSQCVQVLKVSYHNGSATESGSASGSPRGTSMHAKRKRPA